MYLGPSSEMLVKALVLNSQEKKRRDLKNATIEKEHQRSLFLITKSITDLRSTLRDIKATTGHSKEARATSEPGPSVDDALIINAGEEKARSVKLETGGESEQGNKCTGVGAQDYESVIRNASQFQSNLHLFGHPVSAQHVIREEMTTCNIFSNAEFRINSRKSALKNVKSSGVCEKETLENCADLRVRKPLKLHEEATTATAEVLSGVKQLICPGTWARKGLNEDILQHSSVTAWNPVPQVTHSAPKFNEVLVQNNGREERNLNENQTEDRNYSSPPVDFETPNIHSENEGSKKENREKKPNITKLVQCSPAKQRPGMQADHSRLQENEPQNKRPDSQSTVFPGTSYHTTRFLGCKGCEKSHDRVNRQPPSVVASRAPRQGKRSQSAPVSRTFVKAQFQSAPRLLYKGQNTDHAEKFSGVFRTRSTSASAGHYNDLIFLSAANHDRQKVPLNITLSKREKKRILEEMILNYSKSVDKTILEKERQKLLQEKITAFIASLKQHYKNNNDG